MTDPQTPRVFHVALSLETVEGLMREAIEAHDREIVQAIEDGRRIFQALCTERDRLSRLIGQAQSESESLAVYSPAENARRTERWRERIERLTATRAHTEALVEQYGSALRKLPHTPGCGECIELPSGGVWQCHNHYAARMAAERRTERERNGE